MRVGYKKACANVMLRMALNVFKCASVDGGHDPMRTEEKGVQ